MPKDKPGTREKGVESRERVFVDSGAWIALFSARDQHHTEAERLFRETVGGRVEMLTTNLILAEIHRLLLFRAGARAAATALDRIEANPLVRIEFPMAAHHQAARAWLERLGGHPITYTDAVSFAVMETSGCTDVVSFDSDFLVAGFRKRS